MLEEGTAQEHVGAGLPVSWAKVIDHESCIGCHACSTACKSENEVPLSVNRTYVKYVDVGTFPNARRAFQVTRCNQCEEAPCTHACPTSAMARREDGIVDFDKSICIGCKACIAACPYDAIFINPDDGGAEKCNFCAHRLDVGLEPACVTVCPTQAILIGDVNDPTSRVSQIVQREAVTVRRPEKETRPKLFYKGGHQATLDPLAARRPEGGLFMWSEQAKGDGSVVSGHPGREHATGSSSAAALLSYDVPHQTPWGWRVSLYTLTKGIAAGAYLVPALLVAFGLLAPESLLWRWAAPLLAGIFLALTGGLLIWDLKKPKLFYLIFTRPQWRSWLVRGGVILTVYGAVLALHLLASSMGWGFHGLLAWLGVPAAAMTAIYTAYLFAQAKARDLWQSPLLPPHLAAQALLAGAGALLPLTLFVEPVAASLVAWVLAGATAVHLLMVAGEHSLTAVTAHARLAAQEMTHGRFRSFFRAGVVLGLAGMAVPWAGPLGFGLSLLALLGLAAFEHAFVQAGQSVPLA